MARGRQLEDWLQVPEIKYLRVRGPGTRGEWLIRFSPWPWKYKLAENERRSVVASLIRKFPFQALWHPNWNDNANHPTWTLHSPTHPLESIESQHEGGWALFLFNRDPGPALARISGLPTDADELKKLLTTLSAQAVIVSWYDDNEWILVSKQGTGVQIAR